MKTLLRLQQFNKPHQSEEPGNFVLVRGENRKELGRKVKCLVLEISLRTTQKILLKEYPRFPTKYVKIKLAIPGINKVVQLNIYSRMETRKWYSIRAGSFVELGSAKMLHHHLKWMEMKIEELVVARKL